MIKITKEKLYLVNGGNKEDYDAGYTIGRGIKQAINAVGNAVSNAWDWVCDKWPF